MAQLKGTTVDGNLTVNSNIYLDNTKILYGKDTDGVNHSLVQFNHNNDSIFGYGGYYNNIGNSLLFGNDVGIRSKGGFLITSPDAGLNNRAYGVNKVLWSGGKYMTGDHTETLSEAISAQPNGVVFVWCAYINGKVDNSNFSYHFVPKSHVLNFPGSGVDMTVFNSNWSKCGTKYLYINDTTITGHANNGLTGTGANGVTYANNYWVLRQVIGV